MLANALITKLPTTEGRRAYFEYWFLKALNGEPKLILMGVNQEFFINILKDDLIHPRNKPRSKTAFGRIRMDQTADQHFVEGRRTRYDPKMARQHPNVGGVGVYRSR